MTERRIYVGGLNDDNCKCPPIDSGKAMFHFKPTEDHSIQEVHLYEPNNIVIGDFNWLKTNWNQVELWFREEDGSHFQDLTFFIENKGNDESYYNVKYPITKSLYYKEGYAGRCNICDIVTIDHCTACPKWLCNNKRCWRYHGIDETEGWN